LALACSSATRNADSRRSPVSSSAPAALTASQTAMNCRCKRAASGPGSSSADIRLRASASLIASARSSGGGEKSGIALPRLVLFPVRSSLMHSAGHLTLRSLHSRLPASLHQLDGTPTRRPFATSLQPLILLPRRRTGVKMAGGTARDVVASLVRLRPRYSLTPGAGSLRGCSLLLRARGSVSSARPRFPGRYQLAG
jgi:hypothetical protein